MDPMVIAAAAVLVIGAIGAAVVSGIKAWGSMRADLIALALKAHDIHDLVNGASTAAAEKMRAMETAIADLHAKLEHVQVQRVMDAKELVGIAAEMPAKLTHVSSQVGEHDSWEREERLELATAIREIRQYMTRLAAMPAKDSP